VRAREQREHKKHENEEICFLKIAIPPSAVEGPKDVLSHGDSCKHANDLSSTLSVLLS
jgi:hypothetical protein